MSTYKFEDAIRYLRNAIDYAEAEGVFNHARRWANEIEKSYEDDMNGTSCQEQLTAVRDYWLERGHKGTAAAIENAIELIEKSTAQELAEAQEPIQPHYIVTKTWMQHLNSEADLEKMGDGKTEVSKSGITPV